MGSQIVSHTSLATACTGNASSHTSHYRASFDDPLCEREGFSVIRNESLGSILVFPGDGPKSFDLVNAHCMQDRFIGQAGMPNSGGRFPQRQGGVGEYRSCIKSWRVFNVYPLNK